MIEVENHGALIVASNYWTSDLCQRGNIFLSPNAGCIRLLVPPSLREMIEAARQAEYAVCSLGSWPAAGKDTAVELLFEDHTQTPFALHLGPESCGMMPGDPGESQWLVAIWDAKKGRPHKAVERRCYWRRVPSLPWLKPWEGADAPV